jgi:Na+-driven multidrug efflux pump
VRVGNELGAGNPRSAAFFAWVVTALLAFVSGIAGLTTFLLRDKLSYIFTGGEAVSRAVADLCPLLVGTIVLCVIHPVLSGAFPFFSFSLFFFFSRLKLWCTFRVQTRHSSKSKRYYSVT